jgi:hypothetical protein
MGGLEKTKFFGNIFRYIFHVFLFWGDIVIAIGILPINQSFSLSI